MMGGCVVSRNILEKRAQLKWCFREKGINEVDNGWRFLSEIDTDEYLNDAQNMCICKYETIIEIEPAVLLIYELPVGTELTLMKEDKKIYFIDTQTGDKVAF